ALMLDPRVTTGLIADGEHVHPAVCEQLVRVKGTTRIALTTDQTSAAGAPPGRYQLSGRAVVSDGRVVRLEDGTLAGSAATMPDLLRLMARPPGLGAARAISLASTVPARVLGERRLGRITIGACADFVVLDQDLRVRLTMIRGVVKSQRSSLNLFWVWTSGAPRAAHACGMVTGAWSTPTGPEQTWPCSTRTSSAAASAHWSASSARSPLPRAAPARPEPRCRPGGHVWRRSWRASYRTAG